MEEEKEIKVIAPKNIWHYLTQGKEYIGKISEETENYTYFSIKDDDGDLIYCITKGCSHLKFQDWIIKKDLL